MITLLDMWLPGRCGPQDSRPIRCPSASRLCVSHVLQSRACGHNEDMRLAVERIGSLGGCRCNFELGVAFVAAQNPGGDCD